MKIICNGLDVWGNETDGFEVNDIFGQCGSVEVDSFEHEHIILRLIEGDVLYPGKYEIDDFGSDDNNFYGNVVDPKTGRPIIQIKSEK